MNTPIIKNIISNFNFEGKVITLVDDIVFVNLDYFTNRLYQTQGVNEFLYTIGSYKNHIIVFMIRDGVNCKFTGIREIIKKTITDLNLKRDTCYIYGYDDLNLDNSTFIPFNVLQMWSDLTYKKIKDLPISTNSFTKKFAALYGRHDIFRLKICKHLFSYYNEYSLLAFNSISGVYNTRFQSNFDEDENWYKNNCPIYLDFNQSTTWIPFTESLDHIHEHYNKYFLEIVSETDIHTDKFFTEKTMKNLYLGKPFILWSGPYSLLRLQETGFKTFSPYINESYDKIQNTKDRFDAIVAEIDRLAQLSLDELRSIQSNLKEVLEYNRNFFVQFMLTR
jgi:hypothetical protein